MDNNKIIKMNPDTETLYLQQYNALNELKYIINSKIKDIKDQENKKLNEINIERLKAQKSLERLRTKIDNAYKNYSTEKDNLNNEIIEINKKLDIQESDIEKNNHQETLKKLDDQNAIILEAIRQKQKELQSFDEIKAQYYETYQNDLFNLKISFKGDKMAWTQRFDFLQNRLNSHQDDFSIFNSKWIEYHDNHINKVDDVNETISILKEEIDNSDVNKKLERRDNLKIIQQCLSEKRNFKIQIKKFEEIINNCQKEREILIEKQQGWLKIVNGEYNLNIVDVKKLILNIENKIQHNNDSILTTEKNIKNVELDISRGRNDLINSAWGLRQTLGELKSFGDELNKKYQAYLIDLNKIIKTQNETIDNDPYKIEIDNIDIQICQTKYSIDSLTTRQNAQLHKNKFFYEKNKSKLQDIRLEIKNEMDNIDKLNLEYQNEEAKFNEEKSIRTQKINDIEKDIKEHHVYLDGLKNQNDMIAIKITDEYNVKISDVNDLIKKCQDEFTKLKEESNKVYNKKDELSKKNIIMQKTCKYRLEEISKRLQFIDLEIRHLEMLELSYNSDKVKYDNLLIDLMKKDEDVKLIFLPQLNELLQSQIRNNNEIEIIEKKLNINKK